MKRVWRTILFGAASFGVIGLAFYAVLYLWLFRNACDRFDRPLATSLDNISVVYRFEACTTFGTTTDGTVDLVLPNGHRATIFRFSPTDGIISYRGVRVTGPLEPTATWISPHLLRISIGTVGAILEQRSNIDDIRVTYVVGTNLHMESDWQQ